MKKICVILIMIVQSILLFCESSQQKTFSNGNLTFIYSNTPDAIITSFNNSIKARIEYLNSFFMLENTFKAKVTVFDNLQDFHNAINSPNEPDWVVGMAISVNKGIYLVNPNNIKTMNIDEYQKVVVHEYVHLLEMKKYGNLGRNPAWLNEGLAVYLSNQIDGDNNKKQTLNAVKKINGSIIEYLCDTPNNFGYKQGYLISRYLVDYIITNYGKDKLFELFKYSGNIRKVLKKTNKQFESGLIDYLSF